MKYLELFRVHQWVKNLFMLLPLFFAGQIFNTELFLKVSVGIFAFSMVAGFVYILNDFMDLESDRQHPEKKNRPLASGKIRPAFGLTLGFLALAIGLGIAIFLDFRFAIVLSLYLIINLAYSFKLKHIPVLDISIIATGFVLRILAGGYIADIHNSKWIILMTFLLALLLGFAKRRDDVLIFNDSGKKMRKSIDGYNLEFINLSMILMAGVVIVCYIMYTLSPEIVTRWKTENLYLTAFPVIMGVLRYLQLTFVANKSGNPTRVLLRDIIIQFVLIGWIILFYLIIYMQKII